MPTWDMHVSKPAWHTVKGVDRDQVGECDNRLDLCYREHSESSFLLSSFKTGTC